MITRKEKIISIQLIIFLVGVFLLYNTYRDKNALIEEEVTIKTLSDPNTNSFTDIEYSGFDLNGNRYTLNAGTADFKTETPESINMKNVVASFYLQDGTILEVVSEEGLYNNVTLDMLFKKNVRAVYLTNTLLSEQMNYSNSNGKLIASGNVRGESVDKGEFLADNVEYDLASKTLNFSMFDNKQVNVKLKN
ncbi:MAG: Lipopolysaccharide-assembly, LptC-related [Pelagibacterales bacterium]|nr:Lipopolysaccharide-assembly, LptC-related [Pelagibacterales bacterium]